MKLSAQELRWQADSDAETLARYQEIMSDSKRRKAAMDAATTKVNDMTKRITALKKAMGGKLKK